ncbi:hypothetical protein OH76DRAFT_1207222 [Lentinus brumalis]|uniref:Uncharacterized protein n=1 Tax=Lentinus brumalis TaxID=2498619 RepID=A0A371CSX8_9APHY|nr:hypothetical protein OH76DRAFT_1207222 [Polyporus brumalis]
MSCMLSNWTIRPPYCLAMFLYVVPPAPFGRSMGVVAPGQEAARPGEVANGYFAHGRTSSSCGSCEKCEDIDLCTARSWCSLRISRRATYGEKRTLRHFRLSLLGQAASNPRFHTGCFMSSIATGCQRSRAYFTSCSWSSGIRTRAACQSCLEELSGRVTHLGLKGMSR